MIMIVLGANRRSSCGGWTVLGASETSLKRDQRGTMIGRPRRWQPGCPCHIQLASQPAIRHWVQGAQSLAEALHPASCIAARKYSPLRGPMACFEMQYHEIFCTETFFSTHTLFECITSFPGVWRLPGYHFLLLSSSLIIVLRELHVILNLRRFIL